MLYFATHAQANEEEPLESFIALAKTDSHSGYLRIPEIYALNVCAELVDIGRL